MPQSAEARSCLLDEFDFLKRQLHRGGAAEDRDGDLDALLLEIELFHIDFAAVLQALRENAPLPFAHDPAYTSPIVANRPR